MCDRWRSPVAEQFLLPPLRDGQESGRPGSGHQRQRGERPGHAGARADAGTSGRRQGEEEVERKEADILQAAGAAGGERDGGDGVLQPARHRHHFGYGAHDNRLTPLGSDWPKRRASANIDTYI